MIGMYEFYIPSHAQLLAVFSPSPSLGEAQFNRLLSVFTSELSLNPYTSDIQFGQKLFLPERSIIAVKKSLIYAGTHAYGYRQGDIFKNIFLLAGLKAPPHLFPEINAVRDNSMRHPHTLRIQWRMAKALDLTL